MMRINKSVLLLSAILISEACIISSCSNGNLATVSPRKAGEIAIRHAHDHDPRITISEMRAKRITDNGAEWKVDIDVIPDGWDDRLMEIGVRKSDGVVTYFHEDQ
ncbi:MAG: hypothetical protein WC729_08115 [Sphingomonas sp.]|jgi:hypothetical protein|uniref:hypothetical protein n=1 Tax=Sphingomonas sp. TaxID=28214 RepID=UPI00356B26A0